MSNKELEPPQELVGKINVPSDMTAPVEASEEVNHETTHETRLRLAHEEREGQQRLAAVMMIPVGGAVDKIALKHKTEEQQHMQQKADQALRSNLPTDPMMVEKFIHQPRGKMGSGSR